MMTPQVNNTLIAGLQRTLAMRLPGHPPADAVDGMFQAWIAAFDTLPVAWDATRDVPRLEQAFALLWTRAEKWPVPKTLIDCLPPVPPSPALEHKRVWTDEELARNKRRVADILSGLAERMAKQQDFSTEGNEHDTN